MPGKSKHRKKKYPVQSKQGNSRPGQPTAFTPPPAMTQNNQPAVLSGLPASPPRVATLTAKTTAGQHSLINTPYVNVTTELRTIGILTGVMLIILIVLGLVRLPW